MHDKFHVPFFKGESFPFFNKNKSVQEKFAPEAEKFFEKIILCKLHAVERIVQNRSMLFCG